MSALAPNKVHFWFAVPEQCYPHAETYQSWLGEHERQRYSRFQFDRDRHNYLVAHGLLRSCLSRYGDLSPWQWAFSTNAYGRPEIAAPGPPLRFNLSRTRGLVACAVTRAADIGVDVEAEARPLDLAAIAQMSFTPLEQTDLAEARGQQRQRFFQLWTLKEAYVKARGLGLSLPLQGIEFRVGDTRPAIAFKVLTAAEQSNGWQFFLLKPTAEHCAAIAVRGVLPMQVQTGRAVPGASFQVVQVPAITSAADVGR